MQCSYCDASIPRPERRLIRSEMGVYDRLENVELRGHMNRVGVAVNCLIAGDMDVIRLAVDTTVEGDMNRIEKSAERPPPVAAAPVEPLNTENLVQAISILIMGVIIVALGSFWAFISWFMESS